MPNSLTNYQFLPEDIIYYILSFNDRIKYRNGKYMNQISKTDKRYKILGRIHIIVQYDCDALIYKASLFSSINYNKFTRSYEKYSELYVDIQEKEIYYTFCNNIEQNPESYHLWIRE